MESRSIVDWKFYAWNTPFKLAFSHNSATRSEADTILVSLQIGDFKGWGEACPRTYVTGENVASCLLFLNEFKNLLQELQLNSLQDWKDFKRQYSYILVSNPSSCCAIEMAVLDCLSKMQHVSIEALLGGCFKIGPFLFSAILGDVKDPIWDANFQWHTQLGIRDYKLKLNGDTAIDNTRLRKIMDWDEHATIRLDANNKWKTIDEVVDYLNALQFTITAIEEPLLHGSVDALNQLAHKINTAIVLDEHACSIDDLKRIEDASKFIVNLRVSKCGGIMNTIDMAEYAFSQGFGVIIGAQVGESSLLTRAATIVVNLLSKKPIAQEGAYGTNLLEYDLSQEILQFGMNGVLVLDENTMQIGIGHVNENVVAS